MAEQTQKDQEEKALQRIADISTKIREAIRLALPTPPEQFLTVMVPGKVVNYGKVTHPDPFVSLTSDLLQTTIRLTTQTSCIPFEWNLTRPFFVTTCLLFLPFRWVQLANQFLDLMRMPLLNLSLPVSSPFHNLPHFFILRKPGTTIGIDGDGNNEDQRRYEQAMRTLSSEQRDRNGLTLVELYAQKQATYTKAVAEKTKAFHDALKRVQEDPENMSQAQTREAYDKWVQENARIYRNYVQAAYMDWVITGKKMEVEYWFSIVDRDSVMSRVEQSKVSAGIHDSSGTVNSNHFIGNAALGRGPRCRWLY